jgi:hypothetical protein
MDQPAMHSLDVGDQTCAVIKQTAQPVNGKPFPFFLDSGHRGRLVVAETRIGFFILCVEDYENTLCVDTN